MQHSVVMSADMPMSERRIGDYIYHQYDCNIVQGYVGTEEDIVIPILKDGLITIDSLGNNEYVKNVTLNEKVWSVRIGL
jgi:hypothetical protein